MKLPLQISFKNLARNQSISNVIKDRAAKLETFCRDVISCRVTVAVPHRSHRTGNFIFVGIDIRLPGKAVIVNHESDLDEKNRDPHHVLKEAFDAAFRQVEDYNRLRRSSAA